MTGLAGKVLKRVRRSAAVAAAAVALLASCSDGPGVGKLTVFAAASIAPAIEVAGRIWTKKGNPRVVVVTAGSGALARQIEAGAGADILVSANDDWTKYLMDRGLLAGQMPEPLARNALVLIAPAGSETGAAPELLKEARALARALDRPKRGGRLAMGEPGLVPAGTYAKQALETLRLWETVEDRIAPAKDVRGALALVERGEVPLGIVYRTDAMASQKVAVAAEFPPGSHPPVEYRVGIVKGRTGVAVSDFLAWLKTPLGRAVFEKAGFENPGFGAGNGNQTGSTGG